MDVEVAQNSIKYLNSIAEHLKNSTEIEKQLRQSIMQKAKVIEIKNNIILPKKTIKPTVKCPKCCMPRTQGLAEYTLRRNKISKFHRKLKKKVVKDEMLTKYQEKYLRKEKHKYEQILQICCKMCGYKINEDIKKPEFICKKNRTKGDDGIIKSNQKSILKIKSKNKNCNTKHAPIKKTSLRSNKNKINKMNVLLNSSPKIKNTSLKDFIRSVT